MTLSTVPAQSSTARAGNSIHVQVTADLPDFVLSPFREACLVSEAPLTEVEQIAPDAILCSIAETLLDEVAFSHLPESVRAILTYSAGYEHIDLAAARNRNIAVFNTPRVLGDAVAETAILLILGAARRATESIDLIRSGKWAGWKPNQLIGVGLSGKTLGILGLGDIGRRVAIRARAFGMRIIYHNRCPVADAPQEKWLPVDELLAESDVIVLSWPSTRETRHFINHTTLASTKAGSILINIGRGDLVDDDAVIEALLEGRLRAVGLDVFENEPHFDTRYLDLPNAFLLPHIGSSTREARLGMAQVLLEALNCWAAGGKPHNQIA